MHPQLKLLLAEIEAAGDDESRETTDRILVDEVLQAAWDLYADRALLHPRLRYLYTKRHLIDFWLSSVWRSVDYDDDVEESLSQQSKQLQVIRENVDAEIQQVEKDVASTGGVALGQLTTTTPLPKLGSGYPDPNCPALRGDPRYPSRRIRY